MYVRVCNNIRVREFILKIMRFLFQLISEKDLTGDEVGKRINEKKNNKNNK